MVNQSIQDDWDLEYAWDLFSRAKGELDQVTTDKTRIDVTESVNDWENKLFVSDIPLTGELTDLLADFSRTAYDSELPARTSLSPVLVGRLLKRKGEITLQEANAVLDAFKAELEQIENEIISEADDNGLEKEAKLLTDASKHVTPEAWVTPASDKDTRKLIDDLIDAIEALLVEFSSSNSLSQIDNLSQLRIEQLKTILRTTLQLLESPMIETGIIKKASDLATDVASQVVREELHEGLSGLLEFLGKKALELYVHLRH